MYKLTIVFVLLIGCSTKTEAPNPKSPVVAIDGTKNQTPEPIKKTVARTEADTIKLVGIRWYSTNPSIDKDTRKTGAVTATDFESRKVWDETTAKLLDDTMVNNVVSLRAYLRARRDRDLALLGRVAVANTDLEDGGSVTGLTFLLPDEKRFGIPNLDKTRLTGAWSAFWEQHLKGRITETSDDKPVQKIEKEQLPNHFTSGPLKLPAKRSVYLRGTAGSKHLGDIAIDRKGMIRVLSLTGNRDDYLKKTVATLNKLDAFMVIVAPPNGQRGKHGQYFKRDDKWIGPALREHLSHSHSINLTE